MKIVSDLFFELQSGVYIDKKLLKPLFFSLKRQYSQTFEGLKSCFVQILNSLSQFRVIPKNFFEIYEKFIEKFCFFLIQDEEKLDRKDEKAEKINEKEAFSLKSFIFI